MKIDRDERESEFMYEVGVRKEVQLGSLRKGRAGK